MLKTIGAGILALLVLGGGLYAWAYLHREAWYGQDFVAAFRDRIAAEALPGSRYDIDVTTIRVHELANGQRLVCGDAKVTDMEGAIRPVHYGIQYGPKLFGGSVVDLASPVVSDQTDMDYLRTIC